MGSYGAWQAERANVHEAEAERLRAEIEVLRGIVQRITSPDWWLGPPDHSAYPNQWVPLEENGARDWTREPEPLTAAELCVVYGSVVRKEES